MLNGVVGLKRNISCDGMGLKKCKCKCKINLYSAYSTVVFIGAENKDRTEAPGKTKTTKLALVLPMDGAINALIETLTLP